MLLLFSSSSWFAMLKCLYQYLTVPDISGMSRHHQRTKEYSLFCCFNSFIFILGICIWVKNLALWGGLASWTMRREAMFRCRIISKLFLGCFGIISMKLQKKPIKEHNTTAAVKKRMNISNAACPGLDVTFCDVSIAVKQVSMTYLPARRPYSLI